MNKDADVELIEGSHSTILTKKFSYDYGSTPIVSGFSANKLSVLGGERLIITGQNLPDSPMVMFGSKMVKVLTSSNTEILVETPEMQPGLYDLIIPTQNLGYTKVDEKLEYSFFVSYFTPKLSSIQGGSLITIVGGGFK